MAALTVVSPDLDGNAVTAVAASGGGDTIPASSGGEYYVHFRNDSGGSITVTIDDPTSTSPEGATQFNPDTTVVVPAGAERICRIKADRFMNTTTGNISLTYSGVTSFTVSVYRAK